MGYHVSRRYGAMDSDPGIQTFRELLAEHSVSAAFGPMQPVVIRG